MEEHGLERQLVGELKGHHHHAGHPEEQNVVAGFKQRSREIILKVCGLVGPSHGGEGEQPTREPRVKHILVLLQLYLGLVDFGEPFDGFRHGLLLISCRDPEVGIRVGTHLVTPLLRLLLLLLRGRVSIDGDEVRRDAVTPPQLTRDAPGLWGFHEGVPGLDVECRKDLELAALHGVTRPLGHVVAVDPPLGTQNGLDNISGAGAEAKDHLVLPFALIEAFLLELFDDLLADHEPPHAFVLARILVHLALVVKEVDARQAVSHPALEVIVIVRRGDLHGTRSELGVNQDVVRNHRHLAIGDDGVLDLLAHHVLIPLVTRVDGNGYVTQHGLDTRGGDDDVLGGVRLERVAELVDHAKLYRFVVERDREERRFVHLLVVDFNLRDSSLQAAAPVHEPLLAVNEAFLVHAAEGFLDRLVEFLIHGEGLTCPVARRPQPPQLSADVRTRLVLPLPNLLEELVASQVTPGLLLLPHQLLLHHGLCGDASVVCSGEPEGCLPVHAMPASESVLDGAHERVPQVKGTRHVRGGGSP
mmetsp:Transcript_34869/g.67420  ORF Transcript_34869/g.67420 Transcript_34869/m.67420 type:complete len:530 (+) Transcript_34869:1693-3282(+)